MFVTPGTYINNYEGNIFVVVRSINGGIIANDFDKETGRQIGNDHFNHFIDTKTLNEKWEKTDWKLEINVDTALKLKWVSLFRKLFDELNQYGLLEEERDFFEQIEGMTASGNSFINTALFDTTVKNKEELTERIESYIKGNFPEEEADDLIFSESVFYCLVYDLRDSIRKISKEIQEMYEKKE